MSEPFLSEIRIFSFDFAPQGWAFCNGQILNIAQNQALYALLGNLYGGDGRTTFALPNLQGRAPFHLGINAGVNYPQAQSAGVAAHPLTLTEMPLHTHTPMANTAVADSSSPTNNYWAAPASNAYATARNAVMSPTALANTGTGQPHENMSPYIALNFCIALMGIFPPRN